MQTRFILFVSLAIPCCLMACDKSDVASEATTPLDPAPSASVVTTPSAEPSASKPASAVSDDPVQPMELQELTFTSEVKDREPVDVLLSAEPGKRVWAHLRIRNRSDGARKINLEFRVNGDQRTILDLKVEKSWSFRTWAYNTLLEGDRKGTVSLKVTDDAGVVLADTSLPIEAKARTKAYVKKAP